MRAHFRNNSKQFIFDDDDLATKVIIERSCLFKSEAVQKRPAIYVKRGPISFPPRKVGFDDLQKYNAKTGESERAVFAAGSAVCFCISKQTGQVERLAEEVSEVLIAFKPIIRQDFGFTRFDVSSVGEIGVLEESTEFFAVPVITAFEYIEHWTLQYESLILRKIIVELVDAMSGQELT